MVTIQLVSKVATGDKELRPGAQFFFFCCHFPFKLETCACYKPACEHFLTYIADWFRIIQLLKMNANPCLCLQTDEFISSLDKSNGTNRNLTDKERKRFQNITHDLSAVLNPSEERNGSLLPRDLKTAVKFVEVVAE